MAKWTTGDVYVGDFANSNMNGFGFLRYKDRQSYLGYFKNGMYNGVGVRTFPDGSKVRRYGARMEFDDDRPIIAIQLGHQ